MPVRLGLALAGAALARTAAGGPGLTGTNFRGRAVSLNGGPALGLAATLTAAAGAPAGLAAPALVAGLAATAVGRYDDVAGRRPDQAGVKGLRGHLAALRTGQLTAGVVKASGLSLAGLAAAALVPLPEAARGRPPGRVGSWPRRVLDTVLAAGVIAGTANVVNLLDLRPGRALKVGLIVGVPLAATGSGGLLAGPVGAAAGVLPVDLDERVMVGDSGASALGALLGLAVVARAGTAQRLVTLAGLAAITVASERVSFTRMIEATGWLRRLDRLGRRP